MNPETTENNQDSSDVPSGAVPTEQIDSNATSAPANVVASETESMQPSTTSPSTANAPISTTPNSSSASPQKTSKPSNRAGLRIFSSFVLVLFLLIIFSSTFYFIGKHGQKVIIKAPTPPPITLPKQTILVSNCVAGLGKEYIIPSDIPTGPIYYTQNRKVIAVEYNYKAVDIYLNPQLLSNAIIPLTKNYQISSFTTSIGSLAASSTQEAQNDQIQLTMYVVPKAVAQKITCPS